MQPLHPLGPGVVANLVVNSIHTQGLWRFSLARSPTPRFEAWGATSAQAMTPKPLQGTPMSVQWNRRGWPAPRRRPAMEAAAGRRHEGLPASRPSNPWRRRRPAPWSHESRARREAVGRPRAGRRSSAPPPGATGYFEGRGYQVTWALGHLATLKEPQDYDPALKRWSLATLPVRPRAVRAQAARREGGRQAVRGHQAALPLRRRADLRHGRRPRGGADLPLHPGARRLRRASRRGGSGSAR